MSSHLKYTGANIATSYYPSGQAPFDVRSIVDSFSNIKNSLNAFKTSNGDDTSYIGMMVTAYDSGNVYVLTSKNPITWKEIGTDLSKLSGVFHFAGIAEEINKDKNILTTYKVITEVVTDTEGKVTKDSETLHCVTTAYEFDQDLYYGWGTSLEDIRFWTDTAVVTNTTAQYEKGTKEINVKAYEFNGELYYPIDPIVDLPATDLATPYESVDGDIIYITSEGNVYNNSQAQGNTIGTATSTEHTGYDFSVKQSISLEANTSSEAIPASIDNSGHVYQIGENEYASNGQIWVKLGSPVEDWIIL